MKIAFKKIMTFLVINFALSSIFYYICIKDSMNTLVTLCLMWVPAFSSILTQLIYNRNIKGFGWKLGKISYLILSFVLPLITCFIVYSIVWITKIGGVSLQRLTEEYNMPVGAVMLLIPTLLFLFNLFAAAGEEIGWRGFLTSELLKECSYTKTSLIVSLIWFAWHCPLVILSSYHANTPIWYNLIILFISASSFTFITVLVKLKSGSLWTAAIFHASHNLFSQQVFDIITIDYGKTLYITSEFGAGIALVYVLCAVFCIMQSRHYTRMKEMNSVTNI